MARAVGTEGQARVIARAYVAHWVVCFGAFERSQPVGSESTGFVTMRIARSNARDSPGFTEFHRASTETPRLSPSRTDIHHPRANERERLVTLRENRGQLPSLGKT